MPVLKGPCRLCNRDICFVGSDGLCDMCWKLRSHITNNLDATKAVLNELGYELIKKGDEHGRSNK